MRLLKNYEIIKKNQEDTLELKKNQEDALELKKNIVEERQQNNDIE